MTIRPNVNIRELNEQYSHLQDCKYTAPEGCYEDAKAIFYKLNTIATKLWDSIEQQGFKADNCDQFREIEALIYGMIKANNPSIADTLETAEGFGKATNNRDLRDRVIADAKRDRDFIKQMKATQS